MPSTTTITPETTTAATRAEAAAQYGDPEVEAACRAALRRAVARLPDDRWTLWSRVRRGLPENSEFGLEQTSALLRLCDEGEAVLVHDRGVCWLKRADALDRAHALRPRNVGEQWPRNAYDHDA